MTQLMTLAEAARVCNISYAQAASLARQGILPVVRLGRQVRVDQDALETWIKNGGQTFEGGWKKAVN